MSDIARRMLALFRGRSDASGTYEREETSPGKVKKEIKRTAKTLRIPVTQDLWQKHIDGERPLGVITIDENSFCSWGAADIDVYDLDLPALVRRLEEMKIPAVVCRTKSGGAHVFLFMKDPVRADVLMERLRELSASLGHGDCEVFPKQDRVLLDRGDLGNWLNMPYFDSDKTERYAVRADGRGMSIESFLDYAESARLTEAELSALCLTPAIAGFEEAPPCLNHLASVGVSEGGRNNGVFNFGVLAKKMFPDTWETELEAWNRRFISPPLSSAEMTSVFRSLRKKEYQYKCSDSPIVSHCNMALCRRTKFGIGTGGGADAIDSISMLDTDPPLFFVVLKTGGTVECDSASLLNPREFQKLALEQVRMILPMYKLETWLPQVQKCMESVVVIEAPREVGTTGHFEELLERFCTDRHAAEEKDEILLGKPWRDDTNNRVYFRLRDLQALLDRERFRELTRGQITTRIREMEGGSGFFNLRGKGVNVWWVPGEKMTWSTGSVSTPDMSNTPV